MVSALKLAKAIQAVGPFTSPGIATKHFRKVAAAGTCLQTLANDNKLNKQILKALVGTDINLN